MGRTLNIPQIAQHLETTLNELNRFKQYQSISFVAHSLGGLVTRQYILDHFREIKIDTVVLLSTPNFGNHMANLASYFSNNAHLEQLDPGEGKYIDGLNDRWRKEFKEKLDREPFRLAAGYELFPMYKLFVKVGIIVEKYAAIYFASHPQAFEVDHEQIAKAKSKSDPKYIWVRQQLLDLPFDPRNREYSEAQEKRFEQIIDDLQKEFKGTDLEEAFTLISSGKLDEALKLLSKNEEKENQQVLKIAKARFVKGQIYELKLEYNKALEYYEKAMQLAPDNSLYSNDAGVMLITLGTYGKAIDYFDKSLVIDLKTFGLEHPHIAIRWNNLGSAWKYMGDYDKAIDFFEKALASNLKTFGPEHPTVATRLNNLGSAWSNKGDYDKAIDYYEKALAVRQKFFGQDDSKVATSWNNLGSAWSNKGDQIKAIEYYEKALVIELKRFGSGHPHVAMSWNNIGIALMGENDYSRAINYFEKALKSFFKSFGSDHPQVTICWNNLGSAWSKKGDQNKAIDYFGKALRFDLKTFGPDHPHVARNWNNIGMAWMEKKSYGRAIGYFEKALTIFNKANLPHLVSMVEDNLRAAREAKAKGKR